MIAATLAPATVLTPAPPAIDAAVPAGTAPFDALLLSLGIAEASAPMTATPVMPPPASRDTAPRAEAPDGVDGRNAGDTTDIDETDADPAIATITAPSAMPVPVQTAAIIAVPSIAAAPLPAAPAAPVSAPLPPSHKAAASIPAAALMPTSADAKSAPQGEPMQNPAGFAQVSVVSAVSVASSGHPAALDATSVEVSRPSVEIPRPSVQVSRPSVEASQPLAQVPVSARRPAAPARAFVAQALPEGDAVPASDGDATSVEGATDAVRSASVAPSVEPSAARDPQASPPAPLIRPDRASPEAPPQDQADPPVAFAEHLAPLSFSTGPRRMIVPPVPAVPITADEAIVGPMLADASTLTAPLASNLADKPATSGVETPSAPVEAPVSAGPPIEHDGTKVLAAPRDIAAAPPASPLAMRVARASMPVDPSTPVGTSAGTDQEVGLDLDAIFPLAGNATPLAVAFVRPPAIHPATPPRPASDPDPAFSEAGEADPPVAPSPASLAPPIDPIAAAPFVASVPAATVSRASQPATTASGIAIEHHLDVAHDGLWLDRLARDIAASADHASKMRFQLNPERLGVLHVELANGADGATIRFTTDSEAARALIADAQPKLVAEARAQGMRIADTQVDLSNQNGMGQSGSGQGGANAFTQHQPGGQRPLLDRPAAAIARQAQGPAAEHPAARAERYA